MTKTTPQKAGRKPTARSRITNGKIGGMDGRGKWARRFADLIQLYTQDVTDFPADMPQTTKSLIQRAATMTVELERAEASFATDNKASPTALAEYNTTSNSLRRILQDLQVKAGITERLTRQSSGSEPRIVGGRVIAARRIVSTPYDHPADRHLARVLVYGIERAKLTGELLPDPIAAFAVENGFAEYAEDQDEIIDIHPLTIANDNDDYGDAG